MSLGPETEDLATGTGLVEPARDTIYALSSGAPPAGVAVVRVSGPEARTALRVIAGSEPDVRQASVRDLRDPASGELIDRGLVLRFAAGRSVTGEDVAEFHVHGGRAVVGAVLRVLAAIPGLRLAERGEFTKRAFLAGRLDLTEAEGIADLVAAETDAQRRVALGQVQGSIRTQYESWRARIIRARGLIEAELDFSDEEGIAGAWSGGARSEAAAVAVEMRRAAGDLGRADRIRDGAEIVILGPVNAGKSSLLNAIAQRDAAIVSPEAGTTRDPIEVVVDLGGYRATIVDTAGLREAEGAVEREGMRRARARGEAADLVLWLSDRGEALPAGLVPEGVPLWRVATKSDLGRPSVGADLRISAVTGAGVPELLAGLSDFLEQTLRGREGPLVARARHAEALVQAIAALDLAVAAGALELAAEHLRQAADAVGRVTGRVDVEDVLDVVFREFCIGK